jgi:hypothetical protein
MFAEFCQLMSWQNSAKNEILRDHAAPRARAPRPSPRTALTVSAHH